MKYYLFGIGGTGQRVLNSFVEACYMNLITDENGPMTIETLIVDKDNNAGNGADAKLMNYANRKKYVPVLAKPTINAIAMWEPKPSGSADTLDVLATDPSAKRLMEALFSAHERTELAKKPGTSDGGFVDGFKGHPNVGAVYQDAALQDAIDTDCSMKSRLTQINSDIAQGEVRVCIVASLFGGTGASGLPLLVQRLRSQPNATAVGFEGNLKIGCIMMMPYFKARLKPGTNDVIGLTKANSPTADALKYYAESGYMDETNKKRFINDAYMLGLNELLTVGDYSIGSGSQKNRAVFIELTAAMAIRHFYTSEPDSNGGSRAWSIGEDVCAVNGAKVLPYALLWGDKNADADESLLKTIRFSVYVQIILNWGLRTWGGHIMVDNTSKMWLSKFPGIKIVENDQGEMVELKGRLDAVTKSSHDYLDWVCDIFREYDDADTQLIFGELTKDFITALSNLHEDLKKAFLGDDSLRDKPIKTKGWGWGTPRVTQCQLAWVNAADKLFSAGGSSSYSNDIVTKLNAARGETIDDVIRVIYDNC